MHKTLTTEQNSRQKLELKQSDELSSILMKSSFLGANTDGSEVTRTILGKKAFEVSEL